ncbi:MAG: phosphoribosylamine--glycine ligase, partial [Pseudonocardia sp.]|nr:phosphoribosylamine--glycine ligase [Pseudonocardia sp.]
MRVLVVGSGAREHAILLALAQDPGVTALACAPGNAGTASVAEQLGVDAVDPAAVAALASEWSADLVVVGSEVPLVAGVADAVRATGVACFGPSAHAARIEGSKAFAKDVMTTAGVPTAGCEIVDNPAHLDAALDRFVAPYVVKDDGLAAGKGVVVTEDRDLARAHAMTLLDGGHPVLLEEFLDGPEASLFCLVDGATVVPLLPAQDFKRVGDDDTGPNTGGMGAYAPLPWASPGLADELVATVVAPVAAELVARDTPFQGLLYAGLALTSTGPSVIEFNCRFGDPETQVLIPRLKSDLLEICLAVANNRLTDAEIEWSTEAAVAVVMASGGYPE